MDIFSEINSKVILSSFISRYVKLEQKGSEKLGLCPFHNEKTPSFTVNDAKSVFYCFGCGAKGNVISFLQKILNISSTEAIEKVCKEVGIDYKKYSKRPLDSQKTKRQKDILTAAAQLFHANLFSDCGEIAREYLKNRKIDENLWKDFLIGFHQKNESDFFNKMIDHPSQSQQQKFSEQDLISSGLCYRSQFSQKLYSRFSGRLIFPIFNTSGEVIAFGGRTLADENPKYIYSQESEIFSKKNTLYGYEKTKNFKNSKSKVVIVEGYLDVIGVNSLNTIEHDTTSKQQYLGLAPLGTAISEFQIKKAWTLSECPILCMDGDNAGLRSAIRLIDTILPILKPGFSIRVALLPKTYDPASLIFDGNKNSFRSSIENALPLNEFIWKVYFSQRKLDTPESKALMYNSFIEKFSKITDSVTRRFYIEDFKSKWFNFSRNFSKSNNQIRKNQKNLKQEIFRQTVVIDKKLIQQKILLVLILRNPKILDTVIDKFTSMKLDQENLQNLRSEIFSWSINGQEDQLINFLSNESKQNAKQLLSEDLSMHIPFVISSSEVPISLICDFWLDVFDAYEKCK